MQRRERIRPQKACVKFCTRTKLNNFKRRFGLIKLANIHMNIYDQNMKLKLLEFLANWFLIRPIKILRDNFEIYPCFTIFSRSCFEIDRTNFHDFEEDEISLEGFSKTFNKIKCFNQSKDYLF